MTLFERIENSLKKGDAILNDNPDIKCLFFDVSDIPISEVEDCASTYGVTPIYYTNKIGIEISKWTGNQFVMVRILSELVTIKSVYEKL